MPLRHPLQWRFDVDQYLNPFIPGTILPRLPYAISHFLGYRTQAPRKWPPGSFVVTFWAFVGTFLSLAIIGSINNHIPSFESRAVPTIIGSFGAAAVLDFWAIESPLAQPRNSIIGQVISTLTGVAINKLFLLSGPARYQSIRWIGGALSCASATALMALTGTVHPPGGATALMAVMSDDVADLGWFFLAPVMLGCGLMLTMALLVNNMQRRFPTYWWTPEKTAQFWQRGLAGDNGPGDNGHGDETLRGSPVLDSRSSSTAAASESGRSAAVDLESTCKEERVDDMVGRVVVGGGVVQVPSGVSLSPEESKVLEALCQRL